jgi:hypothetical protein
MGMGKKFRVATGTDGEFGVWCCTLGCVVGVGEMGRVSGDGRDDEVTFAVMI